MSSPIATLVCKLNDACRHAAARAASIAMARGHQEVDVEHLLLALLEHAGSDFALLCRRFGLDAMRQQADLEHALSRLPGGPARLPGGDTRMPVFSARLHRLFEQAWLIASPGAQHGRIRSVHLLQALLGQPVLRPAALRASPQLVRIPAEALRLRLDEAVPGLAEAQVDTAAPAKEPAAAANTPPAPAAVLPGTPALQRYTTDLTQRARDGGIDPVIGRDAEIRQLMDILMRRRQNNPLLIGEAGVGKTAVVEGLALRIAAGEVAQALRPVALHALDLTLLQAGAGTRGEFEQRLRQLIAEVQRSPHPIVLFIDEAHTLVGAGGAAGRQDAASLLKPALARGELRTIAATTWSNYRRHVEKDAALARRFQVMKVEEPSPALAAAMLRGLAPLMEAHFGVRIRDEAITEAVRLSTRYIGERQLPDKAIGVLDAACARVALGQHTVPAAIESVKQQLARLEAEAALLQRDAALAGAHAQRLQALQAERRALRSRLDALCTRFDAERALVQELRTLHAGLQAPVPPRQAAQRLLAGRTTLAALQADAPLVPLEVDAGVVAAVVAEWTGIPLGRGLQDELGTVMALERVLARRVIGQPQALRAIAQRLRTSRAGLEDPDKPQAVFLFAGPGGVGKTETARALAEALYGSGRKLIALRMSEYREAHAVSTLKGAPPGYMGCGEGGVLTEAVRRHPHSVVLLDEADQAHPDVLELFHQVCDQGVMDDAEGRTVDFRHCVIILTSHLDAAALQQARATAGGDAARLAQALRPALAGRFKPALLDRLTVVPYLPLDAAALQGVVRLKLERIAARVAARHQVPLRCDEALVAAIQARCTAPDAGARPIDQFLEGTLLPAIAEQLLQGLAGGPPPRCLRLGLDAGGGVRCTAVHAVRLVA